MKLEPGDKEIVSLALRMLMDAALAKSDYESEFRVRQILARLHDYPAPRAS